MLDRSSRSRACTPILSGSRVVPIAALMTGGERFRLSDTQRSQLSELTEDFFARFPDSDALRSISVEQPEDLLDMMGNLARAQRGNASAR